MPQIHIPDDATAEEAAAIVAAIEAVLGTEAPVVSRQVPNRWVRAARLRSQGLPVRGNEERGWRVRLHV